MAKKSKTQRAKASAARQQRKAERRVQEELASQEEIVSDEEDQPKKSLFTRSSQEEVSNEKTDTKIKKTETKKTETKKAETKKPKKSRLQFFRDVRSELHRVTWPTRMDVLRWSGVVVVALLFFGIFVAFFDNVVITPLLYLISGLGA